MDDAGLLRARAELFGSVFIIVQHLTRRTDRELADLGLTTRQWLLLAVLMNAFPDRSPSLSEAAEKYGSSRQNIKQIALGLEARGFVHLVTDPDDARTTRIEITERVRLFDQPEMVERSATMLEDAFAGLTPTETSDLRDLAQRWLGGLTIPTAREEAQT
ncbi:MAG: MarR family transcriptional regulator [Actinobacteria bacterium]|jgi:DNA-binding MarR family transcriptional regulator|nr:MarR family transcriptional regulator [Actinomycetota bacterium]